MQSASYVTLKQQKYIKVKCKPESQELALDVDLFDRK